MRIAVVGTGRIGSFHAHSLSKLASVDDLVVSDSDNDRARTLAQDLGATDLPDVAAVLASKPDGIVVATSTSAHPELVERALHAGIPTFCEKPLSLDIGASAALIRQQAATAVVVQIGFQRRFDVGYAQLREAIESGRLGRLQALRLVSCDRDRPPDEYVPTSGGVFRDMHIHDFDVVHWLTSRQVVEATAVGVAREPGAIADCDDFDNAVTILRLDDDTLVTISGSRANGAGYDARAEAAGTVATVVAGFDDRAPVELVGPSVAGPAQAPYEGFLARYADAYRAEMAAFVQMAAGELASPCPPEASHEALLVAEAVDRSARSGRTVGLDEVRVDLAG